MEAAASQGSPRSQSAEPLDAYDHIVRSLVRESQILTMPAAAMCHSTVEHVETAPRRFCPPRSVRAVD